jgi:hypothetical protein
LSKDADLAHGITLEDYRLQIMEQLKAAADAECAREVLARVDLVLGSTRLSTSTQEAFWESLNSDLHILARESKGLLRREVAAALSTVIEAAQDEVLKYRRLLENDASKPAE